ncbi:hypothetical protein ACS15_2938 [Ralstonia insidiosa]|uniref:Uncharacterized protein n=1 Tax=Ralstonia insidiosa TaxID=190721 RepID=A0AAC9FRQ2_9RALS|nr:hypothetical protein ACS15_2938 [Ralstonia insidiosa]EPX94442.1 hypothetical protein C404_28805 [Ralstonia sp. AU12-08]
MNIDVLAVFEPVTVALEQCRKLATVSNSLPKPAGSNMQSSDKVLVAERQSVGAGGVG